MIKLCPLHLVPFSGDPFRCEQCEPNQADADFIYKSRLTLKDIENVTEEQAEAFFRHCEVLSAQQAAANN